MNEKNKLKLIILTLSIVSFFILLCCTKEKTKHVNSLIFKEVNLLNELPDSTLINKLHRNYLKLNTKNVDSIYQISKIDNKLKKRAKFLFVYTFDNSKVLPKDIEYYNENNSDIYISELNNNEIEFYFSFEKKGWNKLVLITLDQLRMPTDSDSSKLRLIEDKKIYIDSVFVK